MRINARVNRQRTGSDLLVGVEALRTTVNLRRYIKRNRAGAAIWVTWPPRTEISCVIDHYCGKGFFVPLRDIPEFRALRMDVAGYATVRQRGRLLRWALFRMKAAP